MRIESFKNFSPKRISANQSLLAFSVTPPLGLNIHHVFKITVQDAIEMHKTNLFRDDCNSKL